MRAPSITLKMRGETQAVALWADNSARYHVWINRPNGVWTIDETLYKNPPTGVSYGALGYFGTRRLDLTAKANAAVADRLAELVIPEKLDSMASEWRTEEDRRISAERRAATVKHLAKCLADIRDAAPDILAEAAKSLERST